MGPEPAMFSDSANYPLANEVASYASAALVEEGTLIDAFRHTDSFSCVFAEPIFGLGEFVFWTISDEVDRICDVVKGWSVDFVVRRLLSFMVFINPRLSCEQRLFLMSITSRALDQLLWQRSLDPRVLRGIVALACPNQDTGLLFGYLMEVFAGLVSNSHLQDPSDVECASGDSIVAVSCSTQMAEEVKVTHTLCQNFCIEEVYVAAMPFQVRKAVLGALAGGEDLSDLGCGDLEKSSSSYCTPICCITLEPLLCPNGAVTCDVVAVIQRSQKIRKEHAFLYRGKALFAWLGTSTIPMHPETRSLVRPTDIYRLS